MLEVIQLVNHYLWDYFLMYGLIGMGLFLSFRLGFPQITKMGKAFKHVFGPMFSKEKKAKEAGSMSSFQALATAVAAQVGTGNVAGVATAILSGGPGAIFWMWVSAFLGMSTIFVEAVLAQKYRERKDGDLVGGPAYYISKGLGSKGLAAFFSVTIIIALGFIGNMVQSNSIAGAVNRAFGIPYVAVGIAVAVAAALIFIGGMKRIASFAELVVPVMAVIYILASIVILIIFRDQIIPVFTLIFKSAFSGNAVMGGILGATIKQAMQKGIARGLFSNEAGMGSTPHAHAVANVDHPSEQGLTAMVGVFIDTVLVCSATAFAILVTKSYMDPTLKGVTVTQEAFTIAFGRGGEIFLAVCLTFFAFTTVVGWYYFGESNIKYLFGKNGLLPYRILVCAFIVIGSMQEVDLVWNLADTFNGLMVIPNMIALLALSGVAVNLLKDYNKKLKDGNIYYDYDVK